MELGDHFSDRAERAPLQVALKTLDDAVTNLIKTVESGRLEQLDATEKIAVWQRFESIRNKLPRA